jgi:hypothetical protein
VHSRTYKFKSHSAWFQSTTFTISIHYHPSSITITWVMFKARNHAMKSIEIKRHCATSRLDLGSFTRHPNFACGTFKTPAQARHFGKLLHLLLAGPPILRCLLAETMDMASIPRFSKPSPTGFECTVPLHFLSIPQNSLKYSIHTSMDPNVLIYPSKYPHETMISHWNIPEPCGCGWFPDS